jgi:hypothetical protein
MTDHLFTDIPMLTQSCRICSRQFTFPKPKRGRYPVFCSDACRTDGKGLHASKWAVANYIKEPFVCWWCGKFSQRYRTTKFCGRDCRHKMALQMRGLRPSASGNHRMRFKKCRACDESFMCKSDNDKYLCSDQCLKDWARINRPRASFSMYRESPGHWVRLTFEHLYPNGHDLSYGEVRRIRLQLAWMEYVDPDVVMLRDGFKCQSCGVDTPKSLRGMNHPDAPHIDHIRPLAKAGLHQYSNVQLLCRTCNLMKSDDWEYD